MTDRDVEKAGFVTRWSRLKREASHDALSETEETSASVQVSSDDVEDEVMRANRQAAEAVDLDSLGFKSDFSVFMRTGVPAALRRKALRKLWTADPVLANLDGLNDYEQIRSGKEMSDIRSLWQVGHGYAVQAEALHSDENSDDGAQVGGKEAGIPRDTVDDQPEAATAGSKTPDSDRPRTDIETDD
ncbi:DUF3306 domain-containing protein [Roseibium salinum]|uniref:DUF3306 domain-containing protein n=1 Tax=Roseibium salinum TaxID=1604349 RepID=A0ABT3R0E6_9HYPH|nr:DUF3306 domain-containing protein [Roseibium sp. DSM 29163]MCX2722688.1 DUF3306 domain-containing protein [Roseibium sp. DSM 29163]